ncbi:hypothetical protein ABPG77_010201, partial [Micractinium sp. CCAP 211/92]
RGCDSPPVLPRHPPGVCATPPSSSCSSFTSSGLPGQLGAQSLRASLCPCCSSAPAWVGWWAGDGGHCSGAWRGQQRRTTGRVPAPSPWAWIDPGAFALIGAGAFMGGVTRMTLALAVIMMEMSNDVRILLPAMVAIMLAKFVADAATHSLYHGLLEVKCVPFLPKDPISTMSLDLLEVRSVMHSPVVTLREQMRLGDIRDVLRKTRHNGFPVVRDTPQGGVCVGLVVRDHLMKLLVEAD